MSCSEVTVISFDKADSSKDLQTIQTFREWFSVEMKCNEILHLSAGNYDSVAWISLHWENAINSFTMSC